MARTFRYTYRLLLVDNTGAKEIMRLKFRFRTKADDSAYLCDNCKHNEFKYNPGKGECIAPRTAIKLDSFPSCSEYSSTIKKLG